MCSIHCACVCVMLSETALPLFNSVGEALALKLWWGPVANRSCMRILQTEGENLGKLTFIDCLLSTSLYVFIHCHDKAECCNEKSMGFGPGRLEVNSWSSYLLTINLGQVPNGHEIPQLKNGILHQSNFILLYGELDTQEALSFILISFGWWGKEDRQYICFIKSIYSTKRLHKLSGIFKPFQ